MSYLKIPNLKKNSDKNFFNKKLSLRRKSKRKLIKESIVMIAISVLVFYIIYLIPNKILIFNNLLNNLSKLVISIFNSISLIYEIFLALFIVVLLIFALILILGSFYRISKIMKRKTRKIKIE